MAINSINTNYYYTTNYVKPKTSDLPQVATPSLISSNDAVDTVCLNTTTTAQTNKTATPTSYRLTTNDTPGTNIQNIKEILYKLNHPAEGFVAGNTTSSELGDAWDILQHINKSSDNTVNMNTGVSRSQLLQITQKDNWEEGHSNFFGNLNSAFDKLDTNSDNSLSYEELKNFTGWELGSTKNIFQSKIDTYVAEIQSEFQSKSSTGKINFAIEKAKDYMTAMGMTEQLEACERLQNEGKIGFKDCNNGANIDDFNNGTIDSWTLGAYNCLSVDGVYITDDRTSEFDFTGDGIGDLYADGGLFLDQSYYSQSSIQWYELVSTLIHELTHATAYLYSDYPYAESATLTSSIRFSNDTLTMLRDAGCITDAEFNSYTTKRNNGTLTEAEYLTLAEMTSTMWGEYVAYQTNEDYLDSVAKGTYTGSQEATKISQHVEDNYNKDGYTEAKPASNWWVTYGKYN